MTDEAGRDTLSIGERRVALHAGDITRLALDAIVNAANSGLRGGGGVDGAIHRGAGPRLREELREIRERQGGCPAGEAVITSGGELPARFVIHTVGPVWRGGHRGEPEVLASAYRSSLALARDHGLERIAFPSISTGVYGYPIELASVVATRAVVDFLAREPLPREVTFVLFSGADLAVYRRRLAELREDPPA